MTQFSLNVGCNRPKPKRNLQGLLTVLVLLLISKGPTYLVDLSKADLALGFIQFNCF